MAMTDNRDTPQGLAFALAAYGLWGFLPLLLRPATRPVLSGKRHLITDDLPPQAKRRV